MRSPFKGTTNAGGATTGGTAATAAGSAFVEADSGGCTGGCRAKAHQPRVNQLVKAAAAKLAPRRITCVVDGAIRRAGYSKRARILNRAVGPLRLRRAPAICRSAIFLATAAQIDIRARAALPTSGCGREPRGVSAFSRDSGFEVSARFARWAGWEAYPTKGASVA